MAKKGREADASKASDANAALWPGHADAVVTLNSRGTVEGDDGMVSKACEALCQASRLSGKAPKLFVVQAAVGSRGTTKRFGALPSCM